MLRIALVTPSLPAVQGRTENGNGQTAHRWARMLAQRAQVQLMAGWSGEDVDLLLALHARRSAPSIAAFRRAHPDRPCVVALTGTDLYVDLPAGDAATHGSIAEADRLIVLNERAAERLPADLQARVRLVLPSATRRRAAGRPAAAQSAPTTDAAPRIDAADSALRIVVAGHLRAEKAPQTVFALVELLRSRPDIRFEHIGAALQPEWADAARRAEQASAGRYRWLGALSHEATRRRIQRADLLLHPSLHEGAPQAVVEAVCSGTPVLVSAIDGHLGLLGARYPATVPAGHVQGFAAWLLRCRDEPGALDRLRGLLPALAQRFAPAREAQALRAALTFDPSGSPRSASRP